MTSDTPTSPQSLQRRMQLSWVVLFLGFCMLMGTIVAIPFGLQTFQEQATTPLEIKIQASSGTLLIDGTRPLDANRPSEEIDVYSNIRTYNVLDQGIVQFYSKDLNRRARILIYGETLVYLNEAKEPRFARSKQPDQIRLQLNYGRIRFTLSPMEEDHYVSALIKTKHGEILVDQEGEYSVDVTNTETQITVLKGNAYASNEAGLRLEAANSQRVQFSAEEMLGPFDNQQNLIQNHDFSDRLNQWVQLPWEYAEDAEEAGGSTDTEDMLGEPVLRIRRQGAGHADVELRQTIDSDKSDLTNKSELLLLIDFIIRYQTVKVCGIEGTECPLSVIITFENEIGGTFDWKQGIYADGIPNDDGYPGFCRPCPPQLRVNDHWKAIPLGEVSTFESGNLLTQLQDEGFFPVRVKNVHIVSEGHSFEVDILNINLIAKE